MKRDVSIWLILPIMIVIGLILVIIVIAPNKQSVSTESVGESASNTETSAEPLPDETGKASIVIDESNELEEQAANASVHTQIEEIIELEDAIDTINKFTSND